MTVSLPVVAPDDSKTRFLNIKDRADLNAFLHLTETVTADGLVRFILPDYRLSTFSFIPDSPFKAFVLGFVFNNTSRHEGTNQCILVLHAAQCSRRATNMVPQTLWSFHVCGTNVFPIAARWNDTQTTVSAQSSRLLRVLRMN